MMLQSDYYELVAAAATRLKRNARYRARLVAKHLFVMAKVTGVRECRAIFKQKFYYQTKFADFEGIKLFKVTCSWHGTIKWLNRETKLEVRMDKALHMVGTLLVLAKPGLVRLK